MEDSRGKNSPQITLIRNHSIQNTKQAPDSGEDSVNVISIVDVVGDSDPAIEPSSKSVALSAPPQPPCGNSERKVCNMFY